MIRAFVLLAFVASALGFAPVPMMRGARSSTGLEMALASGEKVIVIGVAADSGCGEYYGRLTKVFGGANVGPLGGGFDAGSWRPTLW